MSGKCQEKAQGNEAAKRLRINNKDVRPEAEAVAGESNKRLDARGEATL